MCHCAICRSSLRRFTEYWKQRVDWKKGRWCQREAEMVHVPLSLCHLGSRKRKGYRCIFIFVREPLKLLLLGAHPRLWSGPSWPVDAQANHEWRSRSWECPSFPQVDADKDTKWFWEFNISGKPERRTGGFVWWTPTSTTLTINPLKEASPLSSTARLSGEH